MTTKQKILKALYPFTSAISKALGAKGKVIINKANTLPMKSIFELTYMDNKGDAVSFEEYKGKKILLVNTASDCGYTAQYDELQELYSRKKDELVIIAFPSNDFKEQEKGDDTEIEQFCRKNYGITFPIARKSVVKKKENQDTIFQWLTNPTMNGWNSQQPDWNFSKYLLNEHGTLVGYFGTAISPLDKQILEYL